MGNQAVKPYAYRVGMLGGSLDDESDEMGDGYFPLAVAIGCSNDKMVSECMLVRRCLLYTSDAADE